MGSKSARVTRSAFITGLSLMSAGGADVVLAANETAPMSPSDALKKLMDGNQVFVDSMKRKKQTIEERAALGAGQAPFASILSCADSRTTPEIIFNQGLGDIFVVRVAGNVATATETGSLEYGSAVLKSPLILVMGHSSCGAVKAAIDATKGSTFPGDIQELASIIKPAAESSKAMAGDWTENAAKQNVRNVLSKLGTSPVLSKLVKSGDLKIVGACYAFTTGRVTLLS